MGLRLFLGLEIPEEVKAYIHGYTLPFRVSNKGWEHQNDYHLTLLFIGKSEPSVIEQLNQRLQNFTFFPFSLTLTQLEFFNRRVAYLGLKDSPELLQLKRQIEGLFPEFLRPTDKGFIPHITVKRWQRYEYDALKAVLNEHRLEARTFEIEGLTLFKSEKDELNRKYHVVKYWNFAQKKGPA